MLHRCSLRHSGRGQVLPAVPEAKSYVGCIIAAIPASHIPASSQEFVVREIFKAVGLALSGQSKQP